ncbi:hypothetical protein B0H16DRAFT_1743817 [Mycena metata]|uniref:Uncharacterized protein n=1 Tax=Mycena metata TaxID=1033252 RepID=A0AAD7ME81_9AGAR|nr:hypothetical protein B0H16DRAFT_1743817 [Mycena metata]
MPHSSHLTPSTAVPSSPLLTIFHVTTPFSPPRLPLSPLPLSSLTLLTLPGYISGSIPLPFLVSKNICRELCPSLRRVNETRSPGRHATASSQVRILSPWTHTLFGPPVSSIRGHIPHRYRRACVLHQSGGHHTAPKLLKVQYRSHSPSERTNGANVQSQIMRTMAAPPLCPITDSRRLLFLLPCSPSRRQPRGQGHHHLRLLST